MRKLFFAITQLPLLSALWLFKEPAKAKPILALTIGLLYELFLLALTFGKKVWTKLEEQAVEHTANRILTFVSGFAPGFRRRYKKHIINEHGVFNVRGLGLINTYTLPLEGVFVELRVDPSNPQKLNIDLVAQKEVTASQPIWYFLQPQKRSASAASALDIAGQLSRQMDAVPQYPALAIIGPPGSGKTTLLQHMALTLASNRQHRFQVRSSTPILLFLRDHIKAITSEKPLSLSNLLYNYFCESSQTATLKPPIGWFEKELKRGNCIVLLDGLDEVPELQQRQIVSNWVDNQVKNYPSSRFVLTARPQGYRDAPLLRAHVLEVQPFTGIQVQKFIENWYFANEIMASGGNADERVQLRANKESTNLMRRLRSSPSLKALTVNHLLLTMIAMVHRYHGSLPETRVELYAEICEVLLGRWRQTKGVQDALTAAHKLTVLRPLAAEMMESRLRDIETDHALRIISKPLSRLGIEGKAVKDFLYELQASSGLILERESEKWSFAHFTFQEYLSAAYWHKENYERNWLQMVGDSWWHETLRLYAAQGDATDLVQACLDADTLPSLTLAAECLDEKCEIEPNLRRVIETIVIADLESTNTTRRRFATELHLSRRLKSLQPIDDHCEIDLDFITCAEYQLFLDDIKQRGRFFHYWNNAYVPLNVPLHWRGSSFSRGSALTSVGGVRGVEANAFCDWLTEYYGRTAKFRLPSSEEADQYPAQKQGLGTWCRDKMGLKLIGLTTAERATIMQELSNLSSLPLPETVLGSDFAYATRLQHESSLSPFVDLAFVSEHDQHDSARFREAARAIILQLTLKFYLDKTPGLDEIIAALDRNDLEAAQLVAETESSWPRAQDASRHSLLTDLLTITNRQAEISCSRASQRIIARMVEFNYATDPRNTQPMLELYWCCQIAAAREEGKLPLWEGIRIVREQIQL